MSLKAKIEAVIYAAEEPVTLAQLAGLLGQEAQAELDHLADAQQFLILDASASSSPDPDLFEPSDPETLNGEILGTNDETIDLSSGDGATAPASLDGREPEDDPDSFLNQLDHPDFEPLSPEPTAPSRSEIVPPLPTSETNPGLNPLSLEDTPAVPGQGTPASASADIDAKQLAREARAREARLREYFRRLLDDLVRDYATSDRGLEIREVAGGYRLATKPEYHDAVRGFVKSLKPPLKLSLQALETLAVVAYKQPVTAPEISEIRGVDSGGVLGSLMARKLITTAGRKQVIGRPILYKTTKDFLLRFGLKDINELPGIEEFEKMAGELADQDPIPDLIQPDVIQPDLIQQEIPMQDAAHSTAAETTPANGPNSITGANLEEERDATEPQADGDSSGFDSAIADNASIDGRIAGLPPTYDDSRGDPADIDTPAGDAEIQSQLGPNR